MSITPKDYHVVWEIDVVATSPEDAAEEAFKHMQRPGTTAVVFDVTDDNGRTTRVDLMGDA